MGLTLSELWRRIQNIVVTAKVIATKAKDGKMLVKVEYDKECTSDWLPISSKGNSFIKIWMPPIVGEQVTVLRPLGDADGGIILPSIFNKECKEPSGANEHNAIVEFNDGARFEYDSDTKELKVTAESIILVCTNLTVTGDAKFNESVDITGALDVGADISTAGTVEDAHGDLTNFTTTDGSSRA